MAATEIGLSENIRVSIYDAPSLSINIEISKNTTAANICDEIALKLALHRDDEAFYNLILVHSGLSNTAIGGYHCLKTFARNESVFGILDEVAAKQLKKYDRVYQSCRWFYKDIRSAPINLGDNGDLSGSSSSEGEENVSLSDIAYFKQGERRGMLYKRSTKDPNLWRKRLCYLTDRLWCVNMHRARPKALCIPLSGNILLQDRLSCFDFPFIFVLYGLARTYCFMATSISEQQSWITELYHKTLLSKENEAINMAEVLIADEEYLVGQRLQRLTSTLLDSNVYKIALQSDEAMCFAPVVNVLSQSQTSVVENSVKNGELVKKQSNYQVKIHSILNSESEGSGNVSMINGLASKKYAENYGATTIGLRSQSQFSKKDFRLFRHKSRRTLSQPVFSFKSRRQVHSLHLHHPTLTGVMGFFLAVQRYRDLHRHDLNITNRQLWLASMRIYKTYLSPLFARLASEKEENEAAEDAENSNNNNSVSSISDATRNNNNNDNLNNFEKRIDESDDGSINSSVNSSKSGFCSSSNSEYSLDDEVSRHKYHGINEDLLWNISLQALTSVHEGVFANVRKRLDSSAQLPDPGAVSNSTNQSQQQQQNASRFNRFKGGGQYGHNNGVQATPVASSGLSFWPWSSQPAASSSSQTNGNTTTTSTSGVESSTSTTSFWGATLTSPVKSEVKSDEFAYYGNGNVAQLVQSHPAYKFLDIEIRPNPALFDEVLEEVEQLLKSKYSQYGAKPEQLERRLRRKARREQRKVMHLKEVEKISFEHVPVPGDELGGAPIPTSNSNVDLTHYDSTSSTGQTTPSLIPARRRRKSRTRRSRLVPSTTKKRCDSCLDGQDLLNPNEALYKTGDEDEDEGEGEDEGIEEEDTADETVSCDNDDEDYDGDLDDIRILLQDVQSVEATSPRSQIGGSFGSFPTTPSRENQLGCGEFDWGVDGNVNA